MHALSECLERVVASKYPKLEILVLDDSSHDDTSIIIKSFAHAGVRFIPGRPLPEGWLGRNYALDTLAREASGSYVVFMDVDTFITPDTIGGLVGYLQIEKRDMVSVIPRHYDTYRANVFFGTLRYFWQFVFKQLGRKTISSSIWAITRSSLLDSLNLASDLKSNVEPEAVLARQANVSYDCIVSNDALGIGYEKRWRSQVETSKRLLFPLFGQSIFGFLVGLVMFIVLIFPIVFVITGFMHWEVLHTVSLCLLLSYGCMYMLYLKTVWVKRWWLGIALWPYAILQEFVVFLASVWGYSFKRITWKDRSIHSQADD
jgi:glycosyltransferase involved in cell wall biosynthesis